MQNFGFLNSGPAEAAADVAARTFEVRELAEMLRSVLKRSFPESIWVRGQIRNLSRSKSNHVYFRLVTPAPAGEVPAASLNVVLFDSLRREVNRKLGPSAAGHMTEGVEVRILVSVNLYVRDGRLNLKMYDIDPVYTLERLSAERDKLLADLLTTGLLNRNKSLPMPSLPLRVGLVSSVKSAACADFLDELKRSNLGWEVSLVHTPVQGFGCEARIASALATAAAAGVDLIALVRGGGSSTDLAGFDTREVAHAIAGLSVPVITGIGHEIDSPVADVVAHSSFKTPTAAAAWLVDRALEFSRTTLLLWEGIQISAGECLAKQRERLDEGGRRAEDASLDAVSNARERMLRSTAQFIQSARGGIRLARAQMDRHGDLVRERARFRLEMHRSRLQALSASSPPAAARSLKAPRSQLAHLGERIAAHDPHRMMEKGWTTLRNANGRLLRSVCEVGRGDILIAQLQDGRVQSKVEGIIPDVPDREGVRNHG